MVCVCTWYAWGTGYCIPGVGCMLSATASNTAGAGARTLCWKPSALPGSRRCCGVNTGSWSSKRLLMLYSYSRRKLRPGTDKTKTATYSISWFGCSPNHYQQSISLDSDYLMNKGHSNACIYKCVWCLYTHMSKSAHVYINVYDVYINVHVNMYAVYIYTCTVSVCVYIHA